MRITRRTLRTAAVATSTLAVLSLPATAAFAADGAATGDQTQGQGQGQDQGQTQEEGKQDQGQDQGQDQTRKDEDQGQDHQDPQVLPPVERVFVTSVKLVDGSVAKVYKTGDSAYAAEIWAGGSLLDTLTTTGKPAYGQNNGMHVVLNPDGSVRSWMDKTPDTKPTPKPKPKPTTKPKPAGHQAHAKITMPDGRIAKFYQGKNGPSVEFFMPNGNYLGKIDLKNLSTVNDGWTYKIVPQGKGVYRFVVIDTPKQGGNSWVYDFNGKLLKTYKAEKTVHGKEGTKSKVVVPRGTVPKGAVKAGAEGVADVSGGHDEAALIGVGGGMAALGAAGLGFALYHRRSEQG
ncbi:hypothetical protein [Streptomyces sp. NPDC090025]|uniref:hypothetical protein n=1 Tax=Streptomyces sp. NPDC090025 TaxID=3365922 RepID=UPI003837E8B0